MVRNCKHGAWLDIKKYHEFGFIIWKVAMQQTPEVFFYWYWFLWIIFIFVPMKNVDMARLAGSIYAHENKKIKRKTSWLI